MKWLACIGMNPFLGLNQGQNICQGTHSGVVLVLGWSINGNLGNLQKVTVIAVLSLWPGHGVMGYFLSLASVTEISIKVMSSLSACL